MAVDVCTEISSPRISFSYDLNESDFESNVVRSDPLLLNPTIDFDFCLTQTSFSQHLPSADELFSNGRILPAEIKNIPPTPTQTRISHPDSDHPRKDKPTKPDKKIEKENFQKKRLIDLLSSSYDSDAEEKPLTTSFWQFRRSSSCSCDNGRRSNGLLKFLTRSNSTGSAPNPKSAKAIQKQNSLKESRCSVLQSNPYCNVYNNNNNNVSWKGNYYLKKSGSRRSYGNGVRINPVLNIPPSYIAKGTVSLFGIGSFFSSKKSKKKKK